MGFVEFDNEALFVIMRTRRTCGVPQVEAAYQKVIRIEPPPCFSAIHCLIGCDDHLIESFALCRIAGRADAYTDRGVYIILNMQFTVRDTGLDPLAEL